MASPSLAYPLSLVPRCTALFAARDDLSGQISKGGARILIVEDDFIAASEIEAVLCDAGYQIAGIANSGEDAVRLAKAELPDLTIMDIRLLGRMDGVDAGLQNISRERREVHFCYRPSRCSHAGARPTGCASRLGSEALREL